MFAKPDDFSGKNEGLVRITFFVLAALELALVINCAFCFSNRNQAQRSLVQAKSDANLLAHDVNMLKMQDDSVRQTSRFCFDSAVDSRERARSLDTNDADAVAINKFYECSKRFPNDPLAKASDEEAGELNSSVLRRDQKTSETQAEVTRLIQVCRDSTLAVQQIERNHPTHYTSSGEIDYSDGVATMNATHPYKAAAYVAKKRARELLEGLPDPGDKLGMGSVSCDSVQ